MLDLHTLEYLLSWLHTHALAKLLVPDDVSTMVPASEGTGASSNSSSSGGIKSADFLLDELLARYAALASACISTVLSTAPHDGSDTSGEASTPNTSNDQRET